MKLNILGTEYVISYKSKEKDSILKDNYGYCDWTTKEIVIEDMLEKCDNQLKDMDKFKEKTLRHEIIHAFIIESGLNNNSNWARNEECIDWFALQWEKINDAINKIKVTHIIDKNTVSNLDLSTVKGVIESETYFK